MLEKLSDEETRAVYNARIEYARNEDNVKFWNSIKVYQKQKQWRCKDDSIGLIREAFAEKREIILFGSGNDGFASKETLEILGISVTFFCDNNCELIGSKRYGIEVISPDELIKNHSQALVLVTSIFFGDEIHKQLLELGVSDKNIIRFKYGKVIAACPSQYFDVFEPGDNEVFVDAGAYDGATTLRFIDWQIKNIVLRMLWSHLSQHRNILKRI